MSVLPISVPTKKLAAPITTSALSFTVNNILDWNGVALTSAQFGTLAYVVLRNSINTLMEVIEIDATTIASASITITKRGLDFKGGTTSVTANQLAWPANDTLVDFGSDPAQLFTQGFMDMWTNQTVPSGVVKTFTTSPIVPTPTTAFQAATKGYADALSFAGAPDADDATKGIYERATQAELENNTSAGTTTAPLAVTSGRYTARLYVGYAADAGANDTYTATYAPAPTQWLTGMVFLLKCNTTNTGAATFNPNGLGAKTIKKYVDTGKVDLNNNDIAAGQTVVLFYDGTDVVIESPLGRAYVSQAGTEAFAIATGGDSYAVTITPTYVGLQIGQVIRFKADAANVGTATLNVNAIGAKSILRNDGSALVNGDIAINSIVEVAYDGTNFLLLSPYSARPSFSSGTTSRPGDSASGSQVINHNLGKTPTLVRLTVLWTKASGPTSSMSVGTYVNSANACVYFVNTNGTTATNTNSTAVFICDVSTSNTQAATVAVDGTNITLTWTLTGTVASPGMSILWEAFA